MILKTQISRKSPPVTGFSVYANVLFENLKNKNFRLFKEIKKCPILTSGASCFLTTAKCGFKN